MASPVSFGDAFLMAKLALRIGRAFTTGRKSAPAEFREIESQLYSLSAALGALKDAKHSGTGASLIITGLERTTVHANAPPNWNHQDVIESMLNSCQETLSHLENIVAKYSIIQTPCGQDQQRFKEWSHEIKANWRKIAWTSKGGDLAELKSNLTAHTNCLNLVLGVFINSQASRLRKDVDQVSEMLGEIHGWFIQNLKNKTTVAATSHSTCGDGEENYCFELLEHASASYKIICPRAALKIKSGGGSVAPSSTSTPLLQCNCVNHSHVSKLSFHFLGNFDLTHVSFVVRLASNEASWLLYKLVNKATNQLTTLLIKGVPSEFVYEFEETVMHKLNVYQARGMVHANMSTTLVHISHLDTKSPRLNLLETMSDPFLTGRSISAIKFVSGSSHYMRDAIEFIQIVHYKYIELDRLWDEPQPRPSLFRRSRNAEILINYGKVDGVSDENDMIRTIIDMKWNTQIELKKDDETVEVANCSCNSFNKAENAYPAASITSLFRFMTLEAATEFYKRCEAIRMELFVIHLQFPREDEKVVLRVQAQDVHTQRIHINDAEIWILQSVITERFRLVVQSRRGYSVLSQELAEDFFQELATHGRPDYRSMTYEVFLDSTGRRRVRQDPNGLTHLGFADINVDQLFTIGLATLSGGTSTGSRISASNDTSSDSIMRGDHGEDVV